MRFSFSARILMVSMVSVLSLASSARDIRCGKVHGELTLHEFKQTYLSERPDGSSAAKRYILMFDQIDPQLILGRKTPVWTDFENLRSMRTELLGKLQTLRQMGGEKAVREFYSEWDRAYSNFSRRRQYEAASGNTAEIRYGVIDHGLRAAYRDELLKLNPLLPSQMRYALKPLPADAGKARIRKEAVEIVREMESSVDQLYPTSGYHSEKELIEAIHKKGAPLVRSHLEMILNEDVEFAIARPESARWWVPKVGFHNQFVTGSSRGYQGAHGRNALESSRLGVTVAEYADQNADLKPKYGWLIPKLKSGRQRKDVHYGSDYFILDKEKLRDRTTWTPSDSLNPVGPWLPYWHAGQGGTPVHWEHLFIPWARRALLAPLLTDSQSTALNAISSNQLPVGEGLPPLQRAFSRSEYIELQYWGPVTLNDVKVFVFLGSPPAGEFLAELQARKIPIYQSVGGEYKAWMPEK